MDFNFFPNHVLVKHLVKYIMSHAHLCSFMAKRIQCRQLPSYWENSSSAVPRS